jgi:hypothetical protein
VNGTVSDKSVTWKALVGTISAGGTYTAPSKAGTDTVTATSDANTSKSATGTVIVSAPSSGSLPAFPGAQGGGAASVGGRGGKVIEVTNLSDSGTGSLRACLSASGPRTCVFRVAGVISNKSTLKISNPYVTIAGQTAPGGGIVLGGANQVGDVLFITTHDVIVRYITYDGNNPNAPGGLDTGTVGLEVADNAYNVIFDHCSARWAGSKMFPSVSNDAGNVHDTTLQWNLIYEPNSAHPVGIGTVYVSSGSGLATKNDDAHHNMMVNIDHRLPLNQSGTNVRWVNNLIYNWVFFAALLMGGVNTDYIGNKYIDGNMSKESVHVFLAERGDNSNDPAGDYPNGDNLGAPKLYFLNNLGRRGKTPNGPLVNVTHTVNDSEQLAMTSQGSENAEESAPEQGALPSSWLRATPLPAEPFPINADPVENLDSVLLATVGNSQRLDCNGNWVSHRDSQDARVINQYQTRGPGATFSGQFSSPSVAAGTPCTETQHDGIPDGWKSSRGLSTTDPNLHNDTAPNGYTWLENYMNGPAD